MRKVVVSPHNKEWFLMFEMESKKIKTICDELIIGIHHIGSTAIPNINAKPVIDIMIEVINIGEVDKLILQMKQLGYIALGENGIPNRRFFCKR